MKIPVLLYHSNNVSGSDYQSNDHVALANDLQMLNDMGFEVTSLADIALWAGGHREFTDDKPRVGLSFDDGSAFDYLDLKHPTWGVQRSFLNILQDFRESTGEPVHATSFVIAGRAPREQLDRTCLAGLGWWGDDWWAAAQASGLMSIENHSWDHNHPTLDKTCQRNQEKGRFDNIETEAECDAEVAQASVFIRAQVAGHEPTLFAYPWGQSSEFLRRVYLPDTARGHGIRAAYGGGEPGCVERDSDCHNLPRMICGHNWSAQAELKTILIDALR